MTTDRARKLIPALLTALVMVVAACGQKPGVAEQVPGGLPEGASVNEAGQIVDASGNVIGTVSGGLGDVGGGLSSGGGSFSSGSGSSSSSGGTGTGTGSGTGTGTGTGTGDDGDGGSSGPEPSGGDATGVSGTVIKVGTHAPLTGAAPVPSDSAQKGKDLYSKWVEAQGRDIHGRKTETVLKNDNYNPSQAVAVCKEMVQNDKVFMLTGSAGTDQIQACARYAASVGVPYISAGVTEIGLTSLPTYFAVTMTYPDQGPLLADYWGSKLGAKDEKNGMLRFDTPNFQDAHDAFVSALDQQGIELAYDGAVSKNAGTQEAITKAQELSAAGIENVFILVSPTWWIQLLKAANQQGFRPQWSGIGITKTFDTVLTVSCPDGPSVDKAKFFSPFPAWSDIDKFDPDFKKAVNQFYPEENGGDDFMVLAWGFSKVIEQLLLAPGENLTRERFLYFAERARNIKTGVFPPVSFSPDDHFGSSEVHVSEARCSDRRWHTIQSFASAF